ncbi:uncharacterized protein E0L32_011549 [Thyridium curvatum]|uniref:Hydrophobin n=1 Tax=Thyridium curvatum TaxID=1093900 RepID=A0A507BPV1_9PEZI|nr:uncharacterized protein E0L32_011549 [Thyridium curvatum]TPX18800.1 hypothetical protein E0L32_011549 [Thyridium curvatum]
MVIQTSLSSSSISTSFSIQDSNQPTFKHFHFSLRSQTSYPQIKMQFSKTLAILAAAVAVSAAPSPNGSTSPKCTNDNSKQVCCDGLLGGILCTVSILGGSCSGSSYCCETNSAVGALININALNCVKLG